MKRYSTFEKTYKPIEKESGSIMFETYGADLEKILKTDNHLVWTIVDCDGKLVICAGYHLVNRMNYVITEKPWFNIEEHYSY